MKVYFDRTFSGQNFPNGAALRNSILKTKLTLLLCNYEYYGIVLIQF